MVYRSLVLLLLLTLPSARPSDTQDEDCGDCCKIGFEDCPEKDCAKCGEEKVVVCYFVDWADMWKDPGKFYPNNIPSELCTHVSYAFAVLDKTSLTVHPYDVSNDITNGWYEKVVALKKNGLKVLLSVGGNQDLNDGDHWARMLGDATARAGFVKSAVALLGQHHFDGLDIHFGEYNMNTDKKGCPQGNRVADNKDQLNQLLTELKEAFKGNYLLTVAAAASQQGIDECFDMSKVCGIVDWVNIVAYNYHHCSEQKTGAQAPMCGSKGSWGVYDTVKYYLESAQCPANKVVLGVALYAQTFTLAAPGQGGYGWGAAVTKPGLEGAITHYKGGFLAYHEVCKLVMSGYSRGFSKVYGSFAFSEDQFISYDDIKDMRRKACLVNKFGLRGVSVWTLDFDDWCDWCGCGAYPLLSALNRALRCRDIPAPPPGCL